MRIGSLFSGYGGLDLAVQAVLGGNTAWVSDIDKGACKILAHRYPDAPNHGDIRQVNWSDVEPVDVLTGGFPCQDVSKAGKRRGLRPDTRSGLWSQMAYAVDQLRPALVVAENVRGLLSAEAACDLEPCPWCMGEDGRRVTPLRALGAVLGDLADLGYDAGWYGIPASDVGAPHGRHRIFILAWDTDRPGLDRWRIGGRGPGERVRPAGSQPLLPTPNPFHAGNTETPHEWRHRRLDVFNRTGTRHGPALSVVALSILEGHPLDPAHYMPDDEEEDTPPCPPTTTSASARTVETTTPLPSSPSARTASNGSTLLPTPQAHDAKGGKTPEQVAAMRARGYGVANLCETVNWGLYADAVTRWEQTLGRPAPAPTMLNTKGKPHLAPTFVEWMMGLPTGWVTDIPNITRSQTLKALGNGVVPQQAETALHHLLTTTDQVVE